MLPTDSFVRNAVQELQRVDRLADRAQRREPRLHVAKHSRATSLALLVVTELHLQPCRCGQRHRCRHHRHRVADPAQPYLLTTYLLTNLLTNLPGHNTGLYYT